MGAALNRVTKKNTELSKPFLRGASFGFPRGASRSRFKEARLAIDASVAASVAPLAFCAKDAVHCSSSASVAASRLNSKTERRGAAGGGGTGSWGVELLWGWVET